MGSQRPGVLPPPGAEVGVAPYPIVKVVHALPVPGDVEDPALGSGWQGLVEILESAAALILVIHLLLFVHLVAFEAKVRVRRHVFWVQE